MDSRHAVQERPSALKEADLRASSGMLWVSMADSPTTAGADSSFVCVTPLDIISSVPAPYHPIIPHPNYCNQPASVSAPVVLLNSQRRLQHAEADFNSQQ